MLKEIVDGKNKHSDVGINIQEMSSEEKILTLLKNNPKMTAKQLSDMLGLFGRQVERRLAVLGEKGRLERVSANKNGCWKVLKD